MSLEKYKRAIRYPDQPVLAGYVILTVESLILDSIFSLRNDGLGSMLVRIQGRSVNNANNTAGAIRFTGQLVPGFAPDGVPLTDAQTLTVIPGLEYTATMGGTDLPEKRPVEIEYVQANGGADTDTLPEVVLGAGQSLQLGSQILDYIDEYSLVIELRASQVVIPGI